MRCAAQPKLFGLAEADLSQLLHGMTMSLRMIRNWQAKRCQMLCEYNAVYTRWRIRLTQSPHPDYSISESEINWWALLESMDVFIQVHQPWCYYGKHVSAWQVMLLQDCTVTRQLWQSGCRQWQSGCRTLKLNNVLNRLCFIFWAHLDFCRTQNEQLITRTSFRQGWQSFSGRAVNIC